MARQRGTTSGSPFLDLPLELRDLIYTFAFTCNQPISHLRCPKTFPDTNEKLQSEYMLPGLCDESYKDALLHLIPGLGLLFVNKQVYKEAQPILLQENTIRFENLVPPGVPTGQSLDLMKRATKFQIFFNFLITGIEEVVDMLVAHPDLHSVSLHFQFIRGIAPNFLLARLVGDSTRHIQELMSITYAIEEPERDRWERMPEILEPLRHLNVKDDIRLVFHSIGDPTDTRFIPPFIFRNFEMSRNGRPELLNFVEQFNMDMRAARPLAKDETPASITSVIPRFDTWGVRQEYSLGSKLIYDL